MGTTLGGGFCGAFSDLSMGRIVSSPRGEEPELGYSHRPMARFSQPEQIGFCSSHYYGIEQFVQIILTNKA